LEEKPVARSIAELRTVLSKPNVTLDEVRAAALDILERLDGINADMANLKVAFDTHGHHFDTADRAGKQVALMSAKAVRLANASNGRPVPETSGPTRRGLTAAPWLPSAQ
jgi:hypothetical protein